MVRKSPEPSKSEMGSAICRFRHASGLTQEHLADAAGLSVGLIRDLEQGRTHSPRWGSVEALALALGLGEQERAEFAAAWECGAAARGQRQWRSAGRRPDPIQAVTIRLLGPLAAERPGLLIDLGSVRRRVILALVAMRGEAGARLSELTDLLWPDRAPARAAGIVQREISQLRQLLDGALGHPFSHQPIVWTGVSYRLQSGPHFRLDSADFGGLASNGDIAVADGAPDRGCGFYERALQLWRGGAVADLDCLQVHPLVAALNRQRSEVAVRYADAAALAGGHARALPHLREACQVEPLSEVLHARLITALGSTGRRAEAVTVFEQLRDRLGEELGLGPSHLVWRAYGLVIGA